MKNDLLARVRSCAHIIHYSDDQGLHACAARAQPSFFETHTCRRLVYAFKIILTTYMYNNICMIVYSLIARAPFEDGRHRRPQHTKEPT